MTYSLATVLLVIVACAFFWYSRAPRAQTKHLVAITWSAFGPYTSAEQAEEQLRRTAEIILGPAGVAKHVRWIDGHVSNFREWEARGTFKRNHSIMLTGLQSAARGAAFDAAYQLVRADLVAKAQAGAEWINKEFLEAGGHRLEPKQQADGTLQFQYKQIWSDEEVEKKENRDADAIFSEIGRQLIDDPSAEAQALLLFLRTLLRDAYGEAIETPRDVGRAWFACLKAQSDDPDSDEARTFQKLQDAWRPPGDTNVD